MKVYNLLEATYPEDQQSLGVFTSLEKLHEFAAREYPTMPIMIEVTTLDPTSNTEADANHKIIL